MVLLQNNFSEFEMGGGVTKGHQVQIFKKSIFELLCIEKSILGIMGGQNQVKVTKGHQVQFSKSVVLSSYAQGKHFKHHGGS